MTQPIAGVSPSELSEVTTMTVFPSVGRYAIGRLLGSLYNIKLGAYVFTVGNLIALLSIPIGLALYFYRLAPSFFGLPFHGTFFKITNRRVVELRNEIQFTGAFPFFGFVYGDEVKSVALDRFDEIEIEVAPGQQWYDAGNLIFLKDGVETLRLYGISRPDAFRATCLKSQRAYSGVKQALARQAATA